MYRCSWILHKRIIRLANSWGRQSRSKQFGKNLEFCDRKKLRYDWDNKEIEEDDPHVGNPLTAVHPGILEEIPGVELEADREDINTSAIEAVPGPDCDTTVRPFVHGVCSDSILTSFDIGSK